MRPNRMASRTDVGTCALHNFSPAWKKALRSRGMSRRGCRCSTVIPEGPPAAPLLANPTSSKLKSACGSGLDNSLGSGVRGWRVRLVGSLNALRVAADPGARRPFQRLSGRRDFSNVHQRFSSADPSSSIRRPDLQFLRRRRTAACWFTLRLASKRSNHAPALNRSNRPNNFAFGIVPPLARWSNILGNSKNNFHPRS